ncbi:hypothetical protein V865_006119 [Kwoniella europaea PYCC6329]|uniref:Uncharacterized protein n=1 Tax=Kwoniella europaea PYCC6329 TaxID=1423913 RepID=A0AAX4KPY1_9TREE
MLLLRAGGAIVLLSGMNVDARVVKRGNVGNQGSPLLLGPQGGSATPPSANDSTSKSSDDDAQVDNSNNDDNTDSNSDSTTSVSTKTSSTSTSTSTSTSISTSTSSSISTSSTASPNTISSSSPTHTSENRLLPPDPPKQPSSVRYLVPVFLLILITLIGFGYQRYRKRRKRRSRSSTAGKDFEKLMKNGNDPFVTSADHFNPYRGWKEIPSKDDDEDDGIWNSRMDDDAPQIRFIDEEHNTVRLEGSRAPAAGVNGGLVRSGQFISASEKGWGWRESWNNFKSARGKDNRNQFNTLSDLEEGPGDVDGDEIDEKQTMKLVKSNKVSESITYTNILPTTRGVSMGQHDYLEVAIEDELPLSPPREGQIRQLKDQLNSLTYQKEIPPTSTTPEKTNRLERNKSPNNKRQSKSIKTNVNTGVSPGGMPEAPEWIRPRSVSPTNLSILSPPMQPHLFFHPSPLPMKQIEPSIISEYSENGTISTLPSTQNTPQPSPKPNTDTDVKMPRIPSTASGLAGIDSFSVVTSNKMPSSAGINKKEKGYVSSGLNPISNSPRKEKGGLSPNNLNLTLKRSTAIQNLSNPSPSRNNPSSTLSPNVIIDGQKVSKKSRVEKKELKARNQVEDILKASWSDRALISPPLGSPTNQTFADQLRSQGVPGMMSPGLEQGGNGIEQRLALLKGVDI